MTTRILSLLFSLLFASLVSAQDKVDVVVSINPIGEFVQKIGAEKVEVYTLIHSNVDPHSFELTPRDLIAISNANLIVLSGKGFEFWADSFSEVVKQKVVDLSLSLKGQVDDMHTWLDPLMVREEIPAIAQALCKSSPSNCESFRRNQGEFENSLTNFDSEIRAEVAKWPQHSFVSYHPAWSNFAKRYGLTQAAVMKENHSAGVNPKSMIALVDIARAGNINTFVVEPTTPKSQIEFLSKDSHLNLVVLDPLGDEGEGYIERMRRNLNRLGASMRINAKNTK